MAKTIIIADDSDGIREIIKNTLMIKGYSIVEARNGSEAFELYRINDCDLIVTDVDMPKMSGLELVKKIRKEKDNEALPIVVCTGEDKDVREDILHIGASAVLKKPFSPIELINIVAELLNE